MHVPTEFQTHLFSNLESEDLDKVTVKSLDEIKREKEERERLKQSSVVSSLSAANSVATCNISNGGASEVFVNIFNISLVAVFYFLLKRRRFIPGEVNS